MNNHELILNLMAIMRSQLKTKAKILCSSLGFEPWSPGTKSQCATNELNLKVKHISSKLCFLVKSITNRT